MWTTFGVEPEAIDYRSMTIVDDGYDLRPEIIESAYYLYHFTGDERYREMGRTFQRDIIACCRTDVGYTSLSSVLRRTHDARSCTTLALRMGAGRAPSRLRSDG